MSNQLSVKTIQLQDHVNSGQHTITVSGDVLFFDGIAVAPFASGSQNVNDIMILRLPLSSGACSQQVYYPIGYDPIQTPKVIYSLIGEGQTQILAHQLSQVNTDYFTVTFSQPIPNDQYALQAFILKNDSYVSFSGDFYEVNPIRVGHTLYVDSEFGHDGGSYSGLRANPAYPFASLAMAYGAAQSGDRIYLGAGDYTGITIDKDIAVEFSPKARIVSNVLSIASNRTVDLHSLKIDHTVGAFNGSGMFVNSFAKVSLYGQSLVKTNGSASIGGLGEVLNLGDVYHNGLLNEGYKNVKKEVTRGIYVSNDTNSLAVGANGKFYFSEIAPAITFASVGDTINILSGNYSGVTPAKDVTLSFAEGAKITGVLNVGAARTISFKDLSLDLNNLLYPSAVVLDGKAHFYGLNHVTSASSAFTGVGAIYIEDGGLHYNAGIDNRLTANGKPLSIYVSPAASGGMNGSANFQTIQEAVTFASGNQKVFVWPYGDFAGFSIVNKPNLSIVFEERVRVTGQIFLSGTNYQTKFVNLNLDTIVASGGPQFAIYLAAGTTGHFLGDSYIRVPSFSGITGWEDRYSISGDGAFNFANTIYNKPPYASGINLLGDTDGLKPNALLFS